MKSFALVCALLCTLLVISSAHADPYHRFWRGTKLRSLSSADFIQGLTQVFIPATVQVGAHQGLLAYEPVLPAAGLGLPDEVALVSYESKATYDALFATDAGKTYQNLHWQYFDRSASRSLTPQPFSDEVDFEQAYDLHPDYSAWKKGKTTVLVFLRQAGEADEDFLDRAQTHLASHLDNANVQGCVALVSQQYWLEYVSSQKTLGDPAASSVILLDGQSPSDARIAVGHGINLQF